MGTRSASVFLLLSALVKCGTSLRLDAQYDMNEPTAQCTSNCGNTESKLPKLMNLNQSQQIEDLWETVANLPKKSDKFFDHTYQTMYGIFLTQWRLAPKGPKMMEIGLGCNMLYGPGASVEVWKTLMPQVELWEAEYNAACVREVQKRGQLDGINVIVGDQGNPAVVQSWVQQSGGNFDIIVDDGGHSNAQIKTSFDNLWPTLNPGGLYFIEDLQVSENLSYQRDRDASDPAALMPDILHAWTEQLLISTKSLGTPSPSTYKFPLPKDLDFIFCQHEACVLGKSKRAWKNAEWVTGYAKRRAMN